jgi:anaerobic C4-dicarboxylate transporter
VKRTLTFAQRLGRISLFWGVPMVCLELIGIPRHSWATVLILVIPATFVGVFAGAILEHWFVAWLAKRPSSQ